MISCLIFTKDNADAVLNLASTVQDYVDEIVVIDSSGLEDFTKLHVAFVYKNHGICGKFRLIWYPPKGYVESYYLRGIRHCRYDWILMLDDDEIPSQSLLKDLKVIVWGISPTMFYVNRLEPNGSICKVPRFFNKEEVEVTGLIHRGMYSLGRTDNLPDEYYITHNSKASPEKLQRFAKIEAQQYPEIIADSAKNSKYLRYFYFFVSSIPRVLTAPNKKDQAKYCYYLWKELRKCE